MNNFLTSICPIVSWYSLSLVLKKDSVSWIKFPRFSSCRGKDTNNYQETNMEFSSRLKTFLFNFPQKCRFLCSFMQTFGGFCFCLFFYKSLHRQVIFCFLNPAHQETHGTMTIWLCTQKAKVSDQGTYRPRLRQWSTDTLRMPENQSHGFSQPFAVWSGLDCNCSPAMKQFFLALTTPLLTALHQNSRFPITYYYSPALPVSTTSRVCSACIVSHWNSLLLDKASSLQHTTDENITRKDTRCPKGNILPDDSSCFITALDWEYSLGYKTYSTISCCHTETKPMPLFSLSHYYLLTLSRKKNLINLMYLRWWAWITSPSFGHICGSSIRTIPGINVGL